MCGILFLLPAPMCSHRLSSLMCVHNLPVKLTSSQPSGTCVPHALLHSLHVNMPLCPKAYGMLHVMRRPTKLLWGCALLHHPPPWLMHPLICALLHMFFTKCAPWGLGTSASLPMHGLLTHLNSYVCSQQACRGLITFLLILLHQILALWELLGHLPSRTEVFPTRLGHQSSAWE